MNGPRGPQPGDKPCFKRINVSIPEDAANALQSMYDRVNEARQRKGLDIVPMREIISACALRVAAMPTVFICGELLTNANAISLVSSEEANRERASEEAQPSSQINGGN